MLMLPFASLVAKTKEDKAHYDWMGYTGNFIAPVWTDSIAICRILAGTGNLHVQPDDGHQHDGQPLLVVVYHSGSHDWGTVHRSELLSLVWHDPDRRRGGIRPFSSLHDRCHCSYSVAIWMTPRTLIVSPKELAAMGWTQITRSLGLFGLMTAKNTVVNLIILTTFLSFLFYRRSGKTPTVELE